MKDIAIFGAGGFGREVKTIIDAINDIEPTYKIIGFFDDNIDKGEILNGIEVLGGIKELNQYHKPLALAIGIGIPVIKTKVISKINNSQITYPTLIHPNAIISQDDVRIDEGSIICAGNIITCNIAIGRFVTLNLMCTVGHDTIIGDFASFMPSVNISGEVKIHPLVYIGTGAKIINQIEIGESTTVGAGAIVAKSLPQFCTAVGIPAKPIKYHKNNE